MAFLLKKNNAKTTINQIGGLTISGLSLIVTDASSFPLTGSFLITIWDSATYPDPTDDPSTEIIKVTGVSGNTFTIERSQEDTVATAHANGNTVAMLITAGIFEDIEGQIVAGSGDMTKAVYDTDNDGIVDSAESLTDGVTTVVPSEIPKAFTEYIEYFIETTGNDITGDGSFENPFKTINHAISVCPRYANGQEAFIQLSIGAGTFTENVRISGFNAPVYIFGSGQDSTIINGGFRIDDSKYIAIFSLRVNILNAGAAFYVERSHILARYIKLTGGSNASGFYADTSSFVAYTNIEDGAIPIYAKFNSQVGSFILHDESSFAVNEYSGSIQGFVSEGINLIKSEYEDLLAKRHEQNTDSVLKANTNLYPPQQLDGDTNLLSIYGTRYDGQTFRADKTGTLDSVIVKYQRNNSNLAGYADLEMSIHELNESGQPYGTLLGTATVVKENIDYLTYSEITFIFSGVNVIAGTTYGFVVKQVGDGGSSSSAYLDLGLTGDSLYEYGRFYYSYDSGATWSNEGITWSLYFNVAITGIVGEEIIDFIVDGQLQFNFDANNRTISNLNKPFSNGDALRKTTIIDEDTLEATVNKSHDENTDTKLNEGGINEVSAEEIRTLLDTPPAGGDMAKSEYDTDDNGIVDKSEVLNDGTSGGGNEVTALEARQHIDDLNNPHQVTTNQVINTLFGQDLNGNLQPMEDYYGQGGFFELDENFNRIPKESLIGVTDFFFELDVNNDIIPKA